MDYFFSIVLLIVLLAFVYDVWDLNSSKYEKLIKEKYPNACCWYDDYNQTYYISLHPKMGLHQSDLPRTYTKKYAWKRAYDKLKSQNKI